MACPTLFFIPFHGPTSVLHACRSTGSKTIATTGKRNRLSCETEATAGLRRRTGHKKRWPVPRFFSSRFTDRLACCTRAGRQGRKLSQQLEREIVCPARLKLRLDCADGQATKNDGLSH